MNEKVISYNDLRKIKEICKFESKKIILCHGCFDLLHIGHIYYFEAAKKEGDVLIVSVTDDIFISKGKGRPAFCSKERVRFLSHIDIIDYIIVSNFPTARQILDELVPDVYVKGIDYVDIDLSKNLGLKEELEVCRQKNILIKYTKTKKYSSTTLLKQYFHLGEKNG